MPSPIGHALGGLAAGCAIRPSRERRTLTSFAIVGMLADLDLLLPIAHRGPTHSLTAAAIVFVAALVAMCWKNPPAAALRFAAAIGAAYLTHVLLDWLGEDGGPPSGIMALWPFSTAYFVSGLDVFNNIERRYWLPGFWRTNTISLFREIVILAPVAWLAWKLSSHRGSTRAVDHY